MLCPEVWNFKAPRHHFEFHDQGTLLQEHPKDNNHLVDTINAHYLNHSVSVVLPNTSSIPQSFNESLLEDSDYYRIEGLCFAELIRKDFIESFVKKGELSLLTIERKIDVDNLAAITPTGQLLLSLTRETYQKLGIEGKPTFFERKRCSRYVVTIDLKDEKLTPGKKYYERIYNNLAKLHHLTFNAIISWDPPEEKLCPSSVAAWFHKLKYKVTVCHQTLIRRVEYSIDIPILEDEYKSEAFFEWLGLFSINGSLVNTGSEAQYLSSYECPSLKLEIGQVQYLQLTGFLTRHKIKKIFNLVREFTISRGKTLPWCSMDIQGFADSPISWGLKEHNFYMDGDNSFTIILCPCRNRYILRKSLSSNNKPKITQ